MKKECLHCKKEFEAKKDTAKYCSDSCRVMWNRKNTDKSDKVKSSAIHNSVMQALEETKGLVKQMASDLFMFGRARIDGKPLIEGVTPDTTFSVQPVKKSVWDEPEQELVTFQGLLNGMEDIKFSDEKEDYAAKIRAATHLSERQINLLLTNLWAKQ